MTTEKDVVKAARHLTQAIHAFATTMDQAARLFRSAGLVVEELVKALEEYDGTDGD